MAKPLSNSKTEVISFAAFKNCLLQAVFPADRSRYRNVELKTDQGDLTIEVICLIASKISLNHQNLTVISTKKRIITKGCWERKKEDRIELKSYIFSRRIGRFKHVHLSKIRRDLQSLLVVLQNNCFHTGYDKRRKIIELS